MSRLCNITVIFTITTVLLLSCKKAEKETETLDAPTELSHTAEGTDAVVRWAGVEGADGYEVSLNDLEQKRSVNTEHSFDNLEYSTQYAWKVRAYKGELYSEWASSSFTTSAAPAHFSWIGEWQGAGTKATFSLGIIPIPIDAFLPEGGVNVPVNISIYLDPENNSRVKANITNLDNFIPIDTDILTDITLTSKSNGNITARQTMNLEMPYTFETPLVLGELPGFQELANVIKETVGPLVWAAIGGSLAATEIYGVTLSLQSFELEGVTANGEDNAQFVVKVNGKLSLRTSLAILDPIINGIIGDISMTSTMDLIRQ